jgi:glutamine synthetase
MVDSLPHYIAEKSIALFTKHGVLTEGELHSRYEILLEQYIKVINIEAKTMVDMARRSIFPVSSKYAAELAGNILSIKSAVGTAPIAEESLLKELVVTNNLFMEKLITLEKAIDDAASIDDAYQLGLYSHDTIFAAMNELRVYGDKLETLVDAMQWPMPTYAEMLFLL